jgi:non-ribosomal peptide synthetase component E (peptide arylation enzyme)
MPAADRYPPERVRIDTAQSRRWRTLALPQVFERGVPDPARAAVVFEGRARSWAQMREQSRRMGHALIALGLAPAERGVRSC